MNGKPLYFYANDTAVGDRHGDGKIRVERDCRSLTVPIIRECNEGVSNRALSVTIDTPFLLSVI